MRIDVAYFVTAETYDRPKSPTVPPKKTGWDCSVSDSSSLPISFPLTITVDIEHREGLLEVSDLFLCQISVRHGQDKSQVLLPRDMHEGTKQENTKKTTMTVHLVYGRTVRPTYDIIFRSSLYVEIYQSLFVNLFLRDEDNDCFESGERNHRTQAGQPCA